MAQLYDKTWIINQALGELGRTGKFSIDDKTPLSKTCQQKFELCEDLCLGLADWWFLRRSVRLERHSELAKTEYLYSHALPPRMGAPLAIYSLENSNEYKRISDFMLVGDDVHSRKLDLAAMIKVKRDPQYWDQTFRAAFVKALASMLAVPVQQDKDLKEQYHAEIFGTPREAMTGGLMGRLIGQNMAAHPLPKVLGGDVLAHARYGG